MVEEGILDGDFALIRKVDTARDGEIVVALIDDEEATLKTFRREGSMIRLDPANRHYEPQRYDHDQVQIQGRLAGPDPALLSDGRAADRLCRAAERDRARADAALSTPRRSDGTSPITARLIRRPTNGDDRCRACRAIRPTRCRRRCR